MTLLKGFKIESANIRERINSYFSNPHVIADAATITSAMREHVTPYFAHTNSAKCSQNKSGKAQAHSRLFRNCRHYMAGELEVLAPDIIVTQGSEARNALEYALNEGEIVLMSDIRPRSKIFGHKILEIAGKQVLWFHAYHASNYGKFHQQKKQCWEHWAKIAVEWYRREC